jgi:hypothetical protein
MIAFLPAIGLWSLIFLLGIGMAVARPGSLAMPEHVERTVRFRGRSMTYGNVYDADAISIDFSGAAATGEPIVAAFVVRVPPGQESLNVVVPWTRSRFQLNSKHNTLPCEGTVRVGETCYAMRPDECHAVQDFGRGIWPYRSFWNWGVATGMVGGVRVGVNKEAGIARGVRQERHDRHQGERGMHTQFAIDVEPPKPFELPISVLRADYVKPIATHMEKAIREAKIHSSWMNPSEEYETAVREFIGDLFDTKGEQFAADLSTFVGQIADSGYVNSLAQLVLKTTLPGVPAQRPASSSRSTHSATTRSHIASRQTPATRAPIRRAA